MKVCRAPNSAPVGMPRLRTTVSSASSDRSLTTGNEMVLAVSPALNVRVPATALWSSPAAAVPPTVYGTVTARPAGADRVTRTGAAATPSGPPTAATVNDASGTGSSSMMVTDALLLPSFAPTGADMVTTTVSF